jgi:transposase
VIRLKRKPQPHTPSLYDNVIGESYIPENHPLRKIRAAVDFSFVHDLVADLYHDSLGRPAYDPEVMVRLIFLQLQYKLSDRGVIERAQTDHAFRFFLGLDWNDEMPHPTSLTKFRERLGEERFAAVFHGFLRQAIERNLVSNKRLMIDSYSVRADIWTPGFRDLLDRIIAKALRSLEGTAVDVDYLRAEHAGLAADKSYRLGAAFRKLLLDEWLSLAELVAEALEELPSRSEAQELTLELLNGTLRRSANQGKRNIKKDDLLSDVDPDARWNRKKRGRQTEPGFGEQFAVDEENGIVTHVEVTPGNTDDSEMLQAMVSGHIENVGEKPDEVLTDSKYGSGHNRAFLEGAGIGDQIACPPPKGHKRGMFSTVDFEIEFDARGRPTVALCPAGELSEDPRRSKHKHAWVFHFSKAQCEDCPMRGRCSKQKRGRQMTVDQHFQITQRARERQKSAAGKSAQITRMDIERQFAYQQRQGGKRTRYRGLAKNRMLGWMWGMYLNVTRMARLFEESLSESPASNLYKPIQCGAGGT